jgi:hypothetical protein
MKVRYGILFVIMSLVFLGCAVKHDVPKPMIKHPSRPPTVLKSEPPPTEQEYKRAVGEWALQYCEDCTKKLGVKVTCVVQSISKPTYGPDRVWCVMVVIRIVHIGSGSEAIATKDYLQETIAMTIENGKARPYSSN